MPRIPASQRIRATVRALDAGTAITPMAMCSRRTIVFSSSTEYTGMRPTCVPILPGSISNAATYLNPHFRTIRLAMSAVPREPTPTIQHFHPSTPGLKMASTSVFSRTTSYPVPRLPNRPKTDKSCLTCSALTPVSEANSRDESVDAPCCSRYVRQGRYVAIRETVAFDMSPNLWFVITSTLTYRPDRIRHCCLGPHRAPARARTPEAASALEGQTFLPTKKLLAVPLYQQYKPDLLLRGEYAIVLHRQR